MGDRRTGHFSAHGCKDQARFDKQIKKKMRQDAGRDAAAGKKVDNSERSPKHARSKHCSDTSANVTTKEGPDAVNDPEGTGRDDNLEESADPMTLK